MTNAALHVAEKFFALFGHVQLLNICDLNTAGKCTQELKDRIERVKRERTVKDDLPSNNVENDEALGILRDIVTFHGEMVLLENYSALNYTGMFP